MELATRMSDSTSSLNRDHVVPPNCRHMGGHLMVVLVLWRFQVGALFLLAAMRRYILDKTLSQLGY